MNWFEGALSVKAVMMSGRRPVIKLVIDQKKKDKDTAFILRQAAQRQIPVERWPREKIDQQAVGRTHGGIIALAGDRNYQSVQECLDAPQPFIAVLEGIEDPFNLGYAFRTLYAAGCTGVLMGSRDWQTAQPTIVKSSAGASEQLAWCLCEDLGAAVRQCRQAGCVLYCAQRSDAIDYFDADFNQPIVLAIGGELRGLSRDVLEQSDQNIVIPYARPVRSALNGTSAVAAISFEVVRQRR